MSSNYEANPGLYRFNDRFWFGAPVRQPEMAVSIRVPRVIEVGRCLICGLLITSDEPNVTVSGVDHYHTRCWNAMVDRKREEEEENG